MLNISFLRKFILFSMFLMLVQILFGLKVREFIDLNIDIYGFDKKNLWLSNPNIEFYIHRSFSILILASNILLFIFSSKLKLEMKWIKLILILILVEIIAGASMYYFSFPILSQPLHLFIAILIFGFQFNWYLNIKN